MKTRSLGYPKLPDLNHASIEEMLRQVNAELTEGVVVNPKNYNEKYISSLKETFDALVNLKKFY